jgi:hypothetical protein
MKVRRTLLIAVIGIVLVAGLAYATVTFNPTTGVGFVGKGDVQIAFGWNNATAQQQTNNVAFTYVTTDTYEVVNAWASGNPDNPVSLNSHTATVTTIVGVNSEVAYEARQKNQYTGYNLKGWGTVTVDGEVPEVSPTVTYVTFTWDEQVWTGEWTTDPVTGKKVKVYVTVTHETDQLPAYYDEDGNLALYTEGNNKAVLSVTLLDSVGGLFVSDPALGLGPVQIW